MVDAVVPVPSAVPGARVVTTDPGSGRSGSAAGGPADAPTDGRGDRTVGGPPAQPAPTALREWAGLVVVVTARAYRAFLLALVAIATLPLLWSWSSHVVRTGSMEPTISPGDVVVAQPFSDAEEVPVGRILIFRNPARPDHEQLLVHRVVDDRGDGTWTTRGDANPGNDATPVTRDDLRSRAVLLVPFVGRPYVWAASGQPAQLLLLAGWLALTVAAFVVASRRRTEGPGGPGPGGAGGPCDGESAGETGEQPAALAAVGAHAPGQGTEPTHRAERSGTSARRAGSALLAVAALLLGATAWSGTAGAAFTASTANPGSSWTVSASLATKVVLDRPADAVRGTVPLTATLTDTSKLVTAVRIDYAPAGTTQWRTVCTDTTAPYGCSWATASLVNQEYDLRAVAVAGSVTHVSELVEDVLVDNVAPTVVLSDPGTPLRGTVTLAASAGDAHSGVDTVVFQYAATGTTTWREACVSTEEPTTCRLDTTALADGSYSFRAVATDEAGNATTSTLVTNRTVDNRVASVAVTDPGAFLSGTVQVAATAYSPSAIASVRVQRATSGSTTWTDLCTDTTSPYACTWDTTLVANGLYDLRAVLTDTTGRTTTSAVVASRRVDNSPVRAADVQTTQGGQTAGRMDHGDRITLTYGGLVRPASITTGWSGQALAVSVRLRDGNLIGTGSTGDTIDVLRNGSAVALGSINLRQSYIRSLRTVQFNATMTASTVTVGGVSVTQVVLVLGAQTSGSGLSTVSTPSAMVWTPSTTATDLNGRPVSATPVTESGVSDREF
ncbi:signal peptidase I [Nocardioides sp. CPCC 205120]|uniref:signal peptidase I n=1 Tax=Nocardioides sp. CPCC 205120 TaxID=3406462 RepID=UPI003B505F0B